MAVLEIYHKRNPHITKRESIVKKTEIKEKHVFLFGAEESNS